jgi:hypothetical protein
MIKNPLDRIPSFNRVSIRAVLVADGQDPHDALVEAGIYDPVAVRVVPGDGSDPSGGLLGDTLTPNLVAVLEPDQPDDFADTPAFPPDRADSAALPDQPERTAVTTMPAAFGLRTFAPIVGKTARG